MANTPFRCGPLTTVTTWATSASRSGSKAKSERHMHDTVRKRLEMGVTDFLWTDKPRRRQEKFRARDANLWFFPNSNDQIRPYGKALASILLKRGQRNSPPLPDA